MDLKAHAKKILIQIEQFQDEKVGLLPVVYRAVADITTGNQTYNFRCTQLRWGTTQAGKIRSFYDKDQYLTFLGAGISC
jgi:hypothetical protein